MGYIEGFGFKIYQLREAKIENEFLLYNTNEDRYNFYSLTRLKRVIITEFERLNIKYKEFIVDKLDHFIYSSDTNKKGKIKQSAIPLIIGRWIITEVELIDNAGFRPVPEKIFEQNNKKYFNTYNLLPTLNSDNFKEPEELDFSYFKEHAPAHYELFMNLHAKNEDAINDTLYKIADKIQNPHEKAQDCIVFYPGEGAGKGIFYKHVIQPIFGEYSSKILMKKLNNDFNAFLRNSLVLVLEEGRRDLELVETLKEIVTEGTMLINEKGKNQQEEEIYFLTFVFSNQSNPIDLGKRRGSYHNCRPLGKNHEETQKIGARLCEDLPKETNNVLKYLHSLKVNHQKALQPFNTTAKTLVHDLNKTPLELFYDYICSFENIELALSSIHKSRYDYDITFNTKAHNGENYITKDTVRQQYNNFCFLENFKSNLIRHNKDMVQLWSLMGIDEEAHKRLTVSSGGQKGRKMEHIRVMDINNHIKEVYSDGND